MADRGEVREARRALGAELVRLRRAAGLTQHGLASKINGYGRSTVANAETGHQAAHRDFWLRCDAALAAEGALIQAYDNLRALAREDDTFEFAREAAFRDGGYRQKPDPTFGQRAESDASDDNELLHTVTRSADVAVSFAAWAEATDTGPMNLQRFEAETRRLARDYLSQPPLPILVKGADLARLAFSLIQSGHQHLDQTRELYLAAGRLSAFLAWISGDLGQPAAAAEHVRAAWVCADQAGHPTLRAWVMSVASKTAYWDGDYQMAVDAARAGQQYAADGTALVMLACQEADALKASGRIDEARGAILRARDLRGQINHLDDIGGLFSCGPARQTNYEMSFHIAAGESRQVVEAAERAHNIFATGSEWAYGTWAQVKFAEALAHIALGNVDCATTTLSPVLAMPEDKRLDTLIRRADEVRHSLTSAQLGRNAEARELIDRIDEYRRSRRSIHEITQ